MDSVRGDGGGGGASGGRGSGPEGDPCASGVGEPQITVSTDERRMHVRAYNHWVSLLGERPFPTIADLDPARIADFGPNSVLLDFGAGLDNPTIQFLGAALRAECGVDQAITSIAQVPPRSLLSRLTDHYLQIIANRAPVGFEAEFVGIRGHNTFYRGILMPFSSNGDAIDYIYGVINWKEMVSSEAQGRLDAELAGAMRAAPRGADLSPVWADGPGAAPVPDEREGAGAGGAEHDGDTDLADRLTLARESAATARTVRRRGDAARCRALERAYEFARAAERSPGRYRALLAAHGLVEQEWAPLGEIAALVFGAASAGGPPGDGDAAEGHDGAEIAEARAVLSYARRCAVPEGGLARLIAATPDGIRGVVAQERVARRRAAAARPRVPLGERAVVARLAAGTVGPETPAGEPVVLLGRAANDGAIDIVGASRDHRLSRRVLARLR